MKKHGLRTALIFLILGLSLGFGLKVFENYLEQELTEVLRDEVLKACPDCSFEVEELHLSLVSLSGRAYRARVIKGGKDQLMVEEMRATFGLSQILKRTIDLKTLEFHNAFSEQVDPRSTTFQVIDGFASSDPNKKEEPKLKVNLLNLTVHNGKFKQKLGSGTLLGRNVSLDITRKDPSTLIIKPHVERIIYKGRGTRESYDVGPADAELSVTEQSLRVLKLHIGEGRSFANSTDFVYFDKDDTIQGNVRLRLEKGLRVFAPLINEPITGEIALSGTIQNPTAKMQVRSKESDQVTTASPITLLDNNLTGKIQVHAKHVTLEGLHALESNATVSIGGTSGSPTFSIHGSTQNALYEDLSFGAPLTYDLSIGEKIDFTILQSEYGIERLSAQGTLKDNGKNLSIVKTNFSLHNFILSTDATRKGKGREWARVSGSGTFSGELLFQNIKGDATLSVSSPDFAGDAAVTGSTTLRQGIITSSLSNTSQSLLSDLYLDLSSKTKSKFKVVLNDFQPADYDDRLKCFTATASGEYTFHIDQFTSGNGKIELEKLIGGCPPEQTRLLKKTQLPIRSGILTLPSVKLQGTNTEVTAQGSVSFADGYDLSVNGSVYLASLLPLVPGVDDLSGKINTRVLLQGDLASPQLEGTATLENGRASIESAGINAEKIAARVDLKNGQIVVQESSGEINGGTFQLTGNINPTQEKLSTLSMVFQDVVYDPLRDAVLTLSGDLNFEFRSQQEPRIYGEVEVDGAQIEKNFDLLTFIEDIPSLILGSSQKNNPDTQRTDRKSRPILLDISVFASRNVFILTNLLSAELKGDFRITGSVRRPIINGTLSTLGGWFGLKERRFDITSGQISFSPVIPQPNLELLGETYVRSRAGDNVLILLEATGPITTPTITLSSDRGLSQRELLTLLSSGADLTTGSVHSRAEDLELEERLREGGSFLERSMRFLRTITRIDLLTLEPQFNTRRGQLEPTLIAEKKIMEYLSLIGQSFISSGGDQSVVTLQYDLTEKLQLAGSVSTITSENTNAVGIDLKYTVIAREDPYIEYTILGNNFVSRRELLKNLKLTSATQLRESEVDKVQKSIRAFYKRNGFFQAENKTTCLEVDNNCRHLQITINEGPRSKIKKINFSGDPLPKEFEKKLIELFDERYATTLSLQDGNSELTRWLRSEGYIGARVQMNYVERSDEDKDLSVEVTAGQPVSFEFVGNTLFSAEEFLKTINLFQRKQPFGNNTIRILVENMERMYREAGYLFVTIDYSSLEDFINERIYYRINIDEQHQVKIRDVVFHSERYTEEELRNLLAESAYSSYIEQVFTPSAIVEEVLDRNARLLRNLLRHEGYNNATVQASFTLQQGDKEAIIEYTILEQNLQAARHIIVHNFPPDLPLPEIPSAPLSAPKINSYINKLMNLLTENGYTGQSLWTEIEGDFDTFHINLDTPQQVMVQDIFIVGNNSIPEEVIRSHLALQEGDPLRTQSIQSSTRALLKLGLFSRVEVEKLSSSQNQNSLLVRVVERPLTTLEVGTGINSEFGYHIFGETIDKSLFKDGRRLSLRMDAYYEETEAQISRGIASLGYFDPEFTSQYSFAQDLRYQKLELTTFEYDLDRYSLSTSLNQSSDEAFSHNFIHTILRDDLSNVSPGAVIGSYDTGIVDLSFLTFALSYDKRDQVLNPRRGYFARLESLIASDLIGSEANYTSLQGQFSYVVPFTIESRAFAFAHNLRSGISWALDDTDQIPITQRYYLGGRTTIRGFRENSLGPRGDDGAVIGGDILMQNNTEFRYYPSDVLSVHLFFDAGNVFLQDQSVELDELRTSAGLGLRYLSPIGPIGFDLGKPLEERQGEPSIRFHFQVGTTF